MYGSEWLAKYGHLSSFLKDGAVKSIDYSWNETSAKMEEIGRRERGSDDRLVGKSAGDYVCSHQA